MDRGFGFHAVICGIVLCVVATAYPQSNSPREDMWVVNGTVRAIVRTPATIYLGGDFDSVGPYTGHGVPLDTSTGQPVPTYPKVNGEVYACVADGSGGWYIGGNFTRVETTPVNNIAHILSSGIVDPSWNPDPDGGVRALALSGTTLYVGGYFTYVGGQARNRIAALDATTGNAAAWNPNANDAVYTLAISGTTIYAGGFFTSIGGYVRNYIAALDATTASATPWNPNADNHVWTVAISGTTAYAGGEFTMIGGSLRNRIAALDAATGSATTWNPNLIGNIVFALAATGLSVYVGGEFTSIGGDARNNLAAINVASGAADTWNPNPDATVYTLNLSGTKLYIGGRFWNIGGQMHKRIAVWDLIWGLSSWDPKVNSAVNAIAVSGSTVYAGGSFNSVGGQTRNNVAALDAATGVATAWNPNADSTVRALAVSTSNLYVGGDFTSIGGAARNRIAELDASTGAANTWWNPDANAAVYALAVWEDAVYVGGAFTTIGGATRNRIAALGHGSDTASSWNPNANDLVYALAISGDKVYAGGRFTDIGGQPRNRIAAMNYGSDEATAWNPNADQDVCALALSDSVVYAGGRFTSIGGQPQNYVAALDRATGDAVGWEQPNPDAPVLALVRAGQTVFIGGDFQDVAGQPRNHLAAVHAVAGALTAWNPGADAGVCALSASNSAVDAGGSFWHIGGLATGRFAEFAGTPTIWYVNANNGSPTHDGTSWGTAFLTIQEALNAAAYGDEVWVAAGTYTSTTNPVVTMMDGIDLYGGFAGTETERTQRDWRLNVTIVDGQQSRRCVRAMTARLDGFTIKDGYSVGFGGGGLLSANAEPILAHCVFSGNLALGRRGADGSAPTPGEDAFGGAVYFWSHSVLRPLVTECLFTNNTVRGGDGGDFTGLPPGYGADGGDGTGGAVFCLYCPVTFVSCTFSGNRAEGGEGGEGTCEFCHGFRGFGHEGTIGVEATFMSQEVTVTNCALWENHPETHTNRLIVTYSDVQGGCTGIGNIDVDPLFVDPANSNYQLQPGSPCIDTGTATVISSTDLAGVPRPQLYGWDMGAYEHPARPRVISSVRADANPTVGPLVHFTARFNEAVTGVDLTDFALTTSGAISGAAPTDVTGSGDAYTVTVSVGTGNGTIRLDVIDDDSILNAALDPLGGVGAGNGSHARGESYTVDYTTPSAAFTADTTYGLGFLTVHFTDHSTSGAWFITSWAWNFGDGSTSSIQNPAHIYEESGTYTVSLKVTSGTGSDLETNTGYIVVGIRPVWYVDASNMSPIHDGTSWTTAFLTIQEGIGAAHSGQEVWVAAGRYISVPGNKVTMKDGVDLYGGFAGTETDRSQRDWGLHVTIIDGWNYLGCVTAATARLDGFTLRNGYTSTFGGALVSVNAEPTLAHCVFSSNTAEGAYGYSGDHTHPPTAGHEAGGGAIYFARTPPYSAPVHPVVTDCLFIHNTARGGRGGAFGDPFYSGPGADGADGKGGAVFCDHCPATFTNVTFSDNAAYGGAGGYGQPYGDFGRAYGGSIASEGDTVIVVNSILWACTPGAVDGTSTVTYSDVCGGHTGSGNIYADPDFVDSEGDSFQLQASSPCIDSGTASDASSTDLTGVPRPQLYGWDMGAYEHPARPRVISSIRADANPTVGPLVHFTIRFSEAVTGVDFTDLALTTTGVVSGAAVTEVSGSDDTYTVAVSVGTGNGTIRLDVVDDDSIVNGTLDPLGGLGAGNGSYARGESYTVDYTTPTAAFTADITYGPAPRTVHFTDQSSSGAWPITEWTWSFGDTGTSSLQSPDHTYSEPGTYTVTLTVTSGTGTDSEVKTDYIVVLAIPIWYVDVNHTSGTQDGQSWATAFPSIQQAVNAAFAVGDEVWVKGGIYPEAITLKSGTQVYGGFAGTETERGQRDFRANVTTIDATTASPRYHVVTMNAVTNVRLDGFTITGGYGFSSVWADKLGAGILCTSVDATNTIANCTIVGNNAQERAGGIYCASSSSPLITDCIIAGNSASYGGGVYCLASAPTLVRCVISGNSATYRGGGFTADSGAPTLTNCIVSGNMAGQYGGGLACGGTGASPAITNCTICRNGSNWLAGGGLFATGGSNPVLTNCALWKNGGYAIYEGSTDADPVVLNCLFRINTYGDYYDEHASTLTGAAAINALPGNSGNVDGGPGFVQEGSAGITGTWTSAPLYDAAAQRTTLTDANAVFAPDEFVNRLINGDQNVGTQALILTNTATQVMVQGDVTSYVQAGDTYRIVDYRLLSGSGAIDTGLAAGAPADDIALDPRPVDIAGQGPDGTGTEYDIGAYECQDATAPTGSIVVNGGAAYTNTVSVTLTLSATDAGSGVAGMRLSNDGVWDTERWEPYATSRAWTLLAGEGTKAVRVQYSDGAGNVSGYNDSIILDTLAPTAMLACGAPDPTNAAIAVTVTLSEASTTFTVASIAPTNAAVNNFAGDGTAYSFTLMPIAQGPFSCIVTIGGFADLAGNANIAPSNVINRTYDSIAPTVGMDSTATDPTNVSPIPVTVHFSEPVTGFDAMDVVPTGGSVTNFSGTGADYGFDLLPAGQGLVTATINAGAAQDLAATPNAAGASLSRMYDSQRPTVSMISTAPEPTRVSPIHVDVAFSKPMTGFESTDVQLANASISNFGGTGANYSFDLTPADQGVVSAAIPADAAIDGAGNGNQPGSLSRTFDALPPTGTLSIDAGAPYAVTRDVALTLTAEGTGTSVADMQFSNDNAVWSGWEPYGATKAWILSAGDGLKTVYVQYRDAAGNVSTGPISDTIALDATPPTGSAVINAGAAYAGSTSVTLTLSASDGAGSGVADMQFSNDNAAWSGWEAYGATKAWTLSAGDGVKTVYVQYRDAAGNVSTGSISDTITLDTTPPTGAVEINSGAPHTPSTSVTLWLNYGDGSGSGVADMQFSNDGSTWSGWTPAAATYVWPLTADDGEKTVYAQFRDALGNVSTGSIVDTIALDTQPPTGTVVINSAATYTNTLIVTLALTATDGAGSGVADVQFSNDNAAWSGWEPFDLAKTWTLTTGDGLKTVYVQYRDGVGNVSTASITDTITLDTTPPTGTVAINGGAAYTDTLIVTLALTASDGMGSGVADMQFSDDNTTWSGWEPFDVNKTWTLTAGDGLKTVYVQYRDALGHISTDMITDAITLDTIPPTGAILINNDAAQTNTTSVTLSVNYDDSGGSGVVDMQFSNDGSTWSGWEPCAASNTWTLTTGDGLKTVYAQFRDAVGHGSTGTILDTITLDSTALVADIALVSPAETGADQIAFTVTFNKLVAPTFTAEDVAVAGTLTGSVVVEAADPAYTVTVTLADPYADGTVGITVGTDVVDQGGTHFGGGSSPLCHVYNWRGFDQTPENARRYAGEDHTFHALADCGASTIAYQWKWDDGTKTVHDGPTTPEWLLTSLTAANQGAYWCEATYDGVVHETGHATLAVEAPLAVTQQPLGATVNTGESYTFTVFPTGGYPPLQYQWKKDGENISGATAASYTIPAAIPDDSGEYQVEIRDAHADFILSDPAVLVVMCCGLSVAGAAGLALLGGWSALIGIVVLRKRS